MSDPEHIVALSELLDSISTAAVSMDGVKSHEARNILKKAMEDAATLLEPPKSQTKPADVLTLGRPL